MQNNLPRMRVAAAAAAELKKLDPDTYITEKAIRRWMNDGTLPFVQLGQRKLLNLDLLIEKLSAGTLTASTPEEKKAGTFGVIRQVGKR